MRENGWEMKHAKVYNTRNVRNSLARYPADLSHTHTFWTAALIALARENISEHIEKPRSLRENHKKISEYIEWMC